MVSGLNPIDPDEMSSSIPILSEKIQNSNRIPVIELISEKVIEENQKKIEFNNPTTNIDRFLHSLEKKHDPNDISGVLLISDGIFNSGLSPDFDAYPYPIHTLGTGDTISPMDLKISFLDYNRIAYKGSRFPVKVEYLAKGLKGQKAELSIRDENGKSVNREEVQFQRENDFGEKVFYIDADSSGRKKYRVEISSNQEEFNTNNNSRIFHIDVIDDKRSILIAALAPHPDIGAIRNSLEEKEGLEIDLWFPNSNLDLEKERDLVIFHQIPNFRGFGAELYEKVRSEKIPCLFVWGQQMDLRSFMRDFSNPIKGNIQTQIDEVSASLNDDFLPFDIPEHLAIRLTQFPPQAVPFGDYFPNSAAQVLLSQKIGKAESNRPLFLFSERDDQKYGLFMGNGLWRWRLLESEAFENPDLTDVLINSSVQFLVLDEEKERFRFYISESEVLEGSPALFNVEYYNEIFEKSFGNQIDLLITNQDGEQLKFKYQNTQGAGKFQVSGLEAGEYGFIATTTVGEKEFKNEGQFSVVRSELEKLNLTADHNLLRNLAKKSGGIFTKDWTDPRLESILSSNTAQIMTSRQSMTAAIDIKWILGIICFWLAAEWFFRKRLGGY